MKILEACKVAPANSPSQFSIGLTFLDMPWLSVEPTSRVFFYEFPDPNSDFLNIFLPKLKNSLALALHHYLPLAGNLSWPKESDKPVVRYKVGDGVSLTIAESQASFYSLSGDGFRESAILRSLLPDFPTSETQSPVMTLKIVLFPNVGFCIAYVAQHAVMDGRSVSLFLHSWAYLCRNGNGSDLTPDLVPFFERTFVENQVKLEQAYPKSLSPKVRDDKTLPLHDMDPPKGNVLGTFILTRENIDFLKKSYFAYCEKKNRQPTGINISAFTVTSAYVMACLVKATEITAEKTFIGINIDARARLDPPLPSTYIGNCVLGCGNGVKTKDFLSEKDGFFVAVEVVSEALAKVKEGVIKLSEKLEDLVLSIYRDYTGFVVAGSPRFELYKVDFGFGKPKKVEMVSIDKTGTFSLTDDRNENGAIEIGIGLKKHHAEAFASSFANGIVSC